MTEREAGAVEKRIDEKLDRIHNGYLRWGRWTFRILVGLVVVFALSAAFTAYLIHENRARINDIQNQRSASILESCQAQNARNTATKAKLDELVESREEEGTPEEQNRRRESVVATKLLIDALAPFVPDCEGMASERVSPR